MARFFSLPKLLCFCGMLMLITLLPQPAAAQVDEITLGCGGPDYDFSRLREFISWRDSL